MSSVAISLALRIDAALPQTQCTRCGYDACQPYAQAIARGQADINRCPPGGPDVIATLAQLTGAPVKPLDAACGTHGPPLVAIIDEAACIGCTLCIAACPVDAIIGAQKRMHAILPSLCSGCELCVAPCPVDCITMSTADRPWSNADATAARTRHDARNARVARGERIAHRKRAEPPKRPMSTSVPASATSAVTLSATTAPHEAERQARAATVAAALARARARRRAAT